MQAKLFSAALWGADAFRITIEVSVSNGIGYQITGLPDDAIKESLSRIGIAIASSGYQMPRTRLVINLAPAGVQKSGTAFDLPVTVGILLASGNIDDIGKLNDYLIAGEVGLEGSIYPVRGSICMATLARKEGFKGILLPAANAAEASLVDGIDVFSVNHLRDIVEFLQSDCSTAPVQRKFNKQEQSSDATLDFKEVRGQQNAKRAMEIAAAGGHNMLLVGPPGIGKTMLAKRLPSILPSMTIDEALETTRIHSISNAPDVAHGLITERPFRNPHHTASDVALAGGGSFVVPGEISLAHNGVLFLDELPEFKRSAIEVLRQPMEEGKVYISRARMFVEFPASFMLVAAMNPCLCGYYGHPLRKCTCSKRALYWYRRKVSGPLMERIDLQVEVEPVPLEELFSQKTQSEASSVIRDRVIKARNIQLLRFKGKQGIYANAQMADEDITLYCWTDPSARKFLWQKMEEYQLSARSYARVLKIARTISDLVGAEQIALPHIAEAIHFRSLDKPLVIQKPKTVTVTKYPFAI